MKKHRPIDSRDVPRFAEIRTFMRLPHIKTTEDIDYAIIGIPFDTGTTFRPGARFAPAAIRDISSLLKPYNYPLQVDVAEVLSGVDYGDVPVINGYIEESYEIIETTLSPFVEANVVPLCLGGDHSVTLAELRALAKKHGPLALVQFDAHTDTGSSCFGKPYSHGTPFRRGVEEGLIDTAHSIQVGIRGSFYDANIVTESEALGFEVITGFEMQEIGAKALAERIIARVGHAKAFCTFDIDFVDPAYAPGTGAPVVGGFTSHETLQVIRALCDIPFVGYDITEVLPMADQADITSLLASNIAFEFISILAHQRKSANTAR